MKNKIGLAIMRSKKGLIFTGVAVIIKACIDMVLSITGETDTSGAVLVVGNILFVGLIIIGIISSFKGAKTKQKRVEAFVINIVFAILGYYIGLLLVGLVIVGVIILVFSGALIGGVVQKISEIELNPSSPPKKEYYEKDTGHTIQSNSDGSRVKLDGEWVPVKDLDTDYYGVRKK